MVKPKVSGLPLRPENPKASKPSMNPAGRRKPGGKNLLAGLDKLFLEIPATHPTCPVDLARFIIETRE